jgi:hypothetical protein
MSKYWTELGGLVGGVLTVLTFVNGIGFIPANLHTPIGIAVAVLTWVSVNVFHHTAVASAVAAAKKPT